MNEHHQSPPPGPGKRSPSSSWPRRLPLAFLLLSGVSLSFILFFIVREAETKRNQADFERRATIPVTAIQSAVDEHLALLQSIASFYFSSQEVDRNEFRAFTQDGLVRLPALQALAWAPRIPLETRAAHEAAVRAEGYPNYEIIEFPNGLRQRASPRAVYFPVRFVFPETPNAALLGVDLASENLLLQAMDTALSQGAPASSKLASVKQRGRTDRLYRTVVPIFQSGAPHQNFAERQRNLGGYALAIIRPATLVDAALKKLPSAHLRSTAVQAIDIGTTRDVVYVSDNWRNDRQADGPETRSLIKLAGRTLQIVCRPAPGSSALDPLWQSWAVLIGSLMLTLLVAGYLAATWDRAAKIEKQVVQRTAELAQSNATLTEEVAARQKMADALARERYLVDSLMDTVPDHIYFKDRESRFLRINKSMARLFKLESPDEAVGKTDFDFFTSEHAQHAFDDEQHILRTGESLVGREEKETWPDGRVTWASSTKQALRGPDGRIIGTFGISRDITERKRTEQQLADKTDELERSNTELEQFAYVASHDLQEPLRMVASYTQLLGRRYKGKLDSDADEFIRYAVEGATRMQVLINDLLAYSRVGTRGKPFTPTNCHEVLGRTLANLKIAFEETGARLTHDPLPTVMADPTQLTQLFQNLITNALKFRSPGIPPEIHIAVTSPAPAHQPCHWAFAIRDNGIGIEPKYFERIFVLFQRLHTREQYPGTGIGLAVCKKIVERHGGVMWVESKPGAGSTFHFTLPKT